MDSSRHKLYQIVEAAYGTTPATPAWKTVRHTGATLALAAGLMVSEEIRGDRQIEHARQGTRQVGGDINGELSYGTYDEFMEAALGGTWAVKAAAYVATTISAASGDNSINCSANGLPVLEAGDKVTLAGFTGTAGNNQTGLVVVTSTASKMVLSGGVALVTDAAGESVTVTTLTYRLKAGTTRRSFSLLRHFTDAVTAGDEPYHIFVGQEFNTLGFTIGVEAIIGIVFGLMGQNQGTPSDTDPATGTYVAANSNAVMDSFTGTLLEGGAAIATVTELTVTVENGMNPKFVVGSAITRTPSIGRSNGTGQLTCYAETSALLKKFLAKTESSLKLTLSDAAGNKYRLTLPRIMYTGAQMDVSGQGPVTKTVPFQALYDTTTATQIIIDRIAA